MSDARSISLDAPAKLNLALAVSPPVMEDGPRRGWHEIASWFAPIDLADTLMLTRLDDDSLSHYAIHWADAKSERPAPKPTPIDWSITKDLAVRAHLLLEREAGRTLPVRLRLEKRIPVGGGLGGGSSDAAAALRGVNALFELGLSPQRLRDLSRELGSDVAFFLDDVTTPSAHSVRAPSASEGLVEASPRPAFVSGFGDRIERTPAITGASGSDSGETDAHLVLIFPDFGCATGAVYKAFDAIDPSTLCPSARFEERARAAKALAERAMLDTGVSAELFNDLAPAAEAVAPDLRDLREALRRVCETVVHVTGSGSTLFMVARDEEHARWMAEEAAQCGAKTTMVVQTI